CSAWRSTTASAPWRARPAAYSAAVGNARSTVPDAGDVRAGLSDKLHVLVVARLLLHLALPGSTGQLGVDRGGGVGRLLRGDAARAGVRAQHLHVVGVEAQPLEQEIDEGADLGRGHLAAREQRVELELRPGPASQP